MTVEHPVNSLLQIAASIRQSAVSGLRRSTDICSREFTVAVILCRNMDFLCVGNAAHTLEETPSGYADLLRNEKRHDSRTFLSLRPCVDHNASREKLITRPEKFFVVKKL